MTQRKSPRIGLYPGTFDPITLGHLEIIGRAAKIVDRLIVGVAKNAGKGPLFDARARLARVEAEIKPFVKQGMAVEAQLFDKLLVDFAVATKAHIIIRGLRAVSDFEYEFQMAGMNYRLNDRVETIFLMASDRHQFISSRFVKEIARLGGDVRSFVSEDVARDLKRRFAQESGRRRVVPEVRD